VVRAELDAIRLEGYATVLAERAALEQGRAWFAPQYARVLTGYGIDLTAPRQAAARVRSSRARDALLAALDDWRRATGDAAQRRRLEEVLDAAEPNPDAFRMRWRAAVRRQDGEALASLAEEPAAQRLPALAVLNLAEDLQELSGFAAATRLLRSGVERYPGSFLLNSQLGFLFSLRGSPQPQEGVHYMAVTRALRPDSPAVLVNLGAARFHTRDVDGAIRDYRKALQMNPRMAPALANLGAALEARGEEEAARRACREALRIDPGYAPAYNVLGCALQDDDLAGAIRAYRKAIQLDPNFAVARTNLACALELQGDRDGAIDELAAAIRADPRFAVAHYNLGNMLTRRGDHAAICAYRRAIQADPHHVLACVNLGSALLEHGDPRGAIAVLRWALQVPRDRAPVRPQVHPGGVYYLLGLALAKKGDPGEAIRAYRKAIEVNPAFAEAHCNLGHELREQGQFAEALGCLRKGHELGSRRKDWRYPSAEWVRHAEELVALDARLAKVLAGQARPATIEETLRLASLCQQPFKQLHAASARLYAAAFAAAPNRAADLPSQHRYNAACAAALAGCGQGKDAGHLEDRDRGRLRQQARDWLRADLTEHARSLEDGSSETCAAVEQTLHRWQQDAALAGVRGDLAALPEGERPAWRQLWADVERTLARARSQQKM
jgi:tetratricopeptide (TPR) repeat protein